jgi:mono/diheme cytochrome c family protein
MGPHDSSTPGRHRPFLPLALAATATAVSMMCAAAAAAPLAAQVAAPWVVPDRRARQVNPVEATPQNIQRGRELYVRECAGCHGATGANDGDRAPRDMGATRKLSDPALRQESDGALAWKMGEGRGSMPSSWDVLNDRERWHIVLYLRTLAAEPAAAAAGTTRTGGS